MMPHPQSYLLQKITDSKSNGLHSLEHLNAGHIADLSNVLRSFAEETLLDVLERLTKGEKVIIKGKEYYSKK